jgi:outer membrane protein assembly factor BamB
MMISSRTAVTVAFLLAATTLAACGGKSNVRKPAELEAISDPAVTATRVWRARPSAGAERQVTGLIVEVAGDVVYSAGLNGDVHALRRDNGRAVWRSRLGSPIVGGPSVAGERLLVGTLTGEIIALARDSGEELWRQPAPSEVLAPPAGNDEVVVLRTVDGRVVALNAEDGEHLWTIDRAQPPLTLRGLSTPVIVGPVVIVGMDNGRLLALRLDDGQAAWEQTIAVPTGRSELERLADVDASLLLSGDRIIAMSYGGELASLDVFSGEIRWRRGIQSYTGATMIGDRIFVTDSAGAIWALDAETGAAAWKQEALAWRRLSPPAAHEGFVAVADFEGYVHYLAPSDGRIVGRTRALNHRVDAPMVNVDGRLYMQDINGRIAVLELTRRN